MLSRLVTSDSATPCTETRQASLSIEFSRQEYWSGLPCSPPGDLPNPGIKPRSPTLQADSLPSEPRGKPGWQLCCIKNESRWDFPGGLVARTPGSQTVDICPGYNLSLFPMLSLVKYISQLAVSISEILGLIFASYPLKYKFHISIVFSLVLSISAVFTNR